MKKLLVVAVLAIFIGTTAFERPGKTVTYKIEHQFKNSFAGANDVTWVSGENLTTAIFNLNGEQVKAFYSKDGDYLGTTKTFAFDKLPAKALETLAAKYSYPKYNLKECIEFEDANGELNYYISFERNKTTMLVEVSPEGYVDFLKVI